MVDAPALALKQDMNTPGSVPDPVFVDLDDRHPQGPVVFAMRSVPAGGLAEPDYPAGPPFAHPIDRLETLGPFPYLGCLQNLFDCTSCSIAYQEPGPLRGASTVGSPPQAAVDCGAPRRPALRTSSSSGKRLARKCPSSGRPRRSVSPLRLPESDGDLFLGEIRLLHPGNPLPS